MTTSIYMVRHGESPITEGNERTRGLTEKGQVDAARLANLLESEMIEVFVSSPYRRSILTIEQLAERSGKEVQIFEELKERIFSGENKRLPDEELLPILEKSFAEPGFALPGGESNEDCQKRAINVLKDLLHMYSNQKIAIGTHGAVMTLMMGYYDSRYGFDFLLQTSKPDVYRLEFEGELLLGVERVWKVE
ncbi:histidine phosphatase family protein [Bacillus sp. 1P06AnD]|uniref:histidine phosphatase family protein n=1 Tax=Bacillus sp. 1P06AnD TaxID=3132208 RepID=UPI0039A1FF9D